MKILHYNWTQFDDRHDFGGGVGIYLQTLIRKSLALGHNVDFLSSGKRYNWQKSPPHIEQTRNSYESQNVKSFSIVNSPVLAPAHFNFGQLGECFSSPELDDVLKNFFKQHGTYDVIHLHNIEGITFSAISILKSNTRKLYLTAHNYHLICPQIELFKHGNSRCIDNHDGADCFGCLTSIPDKSHTIKYRRYKELIQRTPFGFLSSKDAKTQGKALINSLKNIRTELKLPLYAAKERLRNTTSKTITLEAQNTSWIRRCEQASDDVKQLSGVRAVFKKWRETGVDLSETTFDRIFTVSSLAKQRLVAAGVREEQVISLPIGMDVFVPHAERVQRYNKKNADENSLCIAFLGYPIASKGLPTLLDRLEAMNDDVLSRIRFMICSHLDDISYRRVVGLRSRMKHIDLVAGYSRQDLPAILETVDLGITPSIWWETFNQVSYEMIMHGVPVLMSKHLGISEFSKDPRFMFDPESSTDLEFKLKAILDDRSILNSYWDNEVTLPSFNDHITALMAHYTS